ncbi:MAG: GNAT family N-acetyltransferase, partial [Deinococcus sp.]|nr:GNAT family N-acetyltransferase [Deinococcus sp.]
YTKALEIVTKDPNSDGFLVILTPQAMTDPTQTAEQLKAFASTDGKPILASWMGGAEVATGETILNRANIPTFPYPDTAARAFTYMWRYSYNLRSLYETPQLPGDLDENAGNRAQAEQLIQSARQEGRTILSEYESKQLLAAYGIPTVETHVATSEAEAVQLAEKIGYPVVLKLHSKTITHKSDVGGVQLNLTNTAAVRHAYSAIAAAVRARAGGEHFLGVTVQPMVKLDGYEIIMGSSTDSQFGPVLLFGSGGQLVEVFKDRALALPPLNTTLARRMMEQTRIYTALKGVRGRPPVDVAALSQLLVRFSQLVVEQRWLKEIDINPLLASSERLLALDARVVVHGPEVTADALPQLPIRPYPSQYVGSWVTKDGIPVTIRPIRPEDEPLLVKFHQTLSERSVYLRYFQIMKLSQRIAHERLTRMCFIDYDREMALVADHRDPQTGEHQILAVGRLSKLPGTNEAEFAILVSDQCQRCGLGTELLRRLVQVGRDERLQRIGADILLDNIAMQRVCEKLGFSLHHDPEDGIVRAEIEL